MDKFIWCVVEFGNLVNGKRPDDCTSGCCMAFKARRELSIEEAEEYLNEDMVYYGCDCVYDVYEVDEAEVYDNYYVYNIDEWPVIG